MEVKLVHGLVHEGKTYNVAEVKEMTGQQQEYLIRFENPDREESTLDHIPMILDDLFTSLKADDGSACPIIPKEAYWKLSMDDLYLIIVGIRSETWGNMYMLPTKCYICNHLNKVRIDLDEIKAGDPEISEIELPRSKEKIIFKTICLSEMMAFEKNLRASLEKPNKYDQLGISLALSIENKSPEELRKLPASDFTFLDEKVAKFNTIVDTKSINNCSKCKEEFTSAIPIMDPVFFSQSQTPTIGYPPTISTIELT